MREEAMNWWLQAKKDLRAAKDSFDTNNYEWCAFQSQQGVEKGLKALFIVNEKRIVPTHNIILLAKELKLPVKLIDFVKNLNADYVLARYPNAANAVPADLYTRDMATMKMKYAREVQRWIGKELKL
jgi:HEPN domain-containing protein